MFKPKFLGGILLLSLFSCEKDVTEDSSADFVKKSELDILDYEIYEPKTTDPYKEMRDGIVGIFQGTNPGGETGINKAIWLYEGALSELLTTDEYNDGDSVVTIERDFVLTLSSGKLQDTDIKAAFTIDYNNLTNLVANNPNYGYSSTDVQVMSVSSTALELKTVSSYFVNPVVLASAPSVPSSTQDRWGGADANCNSISTGYGAWKHVTKQCRAVLPRRGKAALANVIKYNSDDNAWARRFFNGDYLFGQPNALFAAHLYPAAQLECVSDVQQDAYAQKIVDEIYNKWGFDVHLKGFRNFYVDKYNNNPQSAAWWLDFAVGDHITWVSGDRLKHSHLFY